MALQRLTVEIQYNDEIDNPHFFPGMSVLEISNEFEQGSMVAVAFYGALTEDEE